MNRPPLIRPLRSLLQGRLSIAAARPSQRHVLRQPARQLRANSSISKEPPVEKETSQQTSSTAPEEPAANVEKPAAKPEEAAASPAPSAADATIEAMREEIRKLQAALLAKEATKPAPTVAEAPVQAVVEEAKKPEVEEVSAKAAPVADAAVKAMVEEPKKPEAEVSANTAPSAPQEADKPMEETIVEAMAEETKTPVAEEVSADAVSSTPEAADKPMEEVTVEAMAEETKTPEAQEVSANTAPSAPQAVDKPIAKEPKKVEAEAWADIYADAVSSVAETADKPVPEEPTRNEVDAEEVSANTAPSAPQAADKPMAEEPKKVNAGAWGEKPKVDAGAWGAKPKVDARAWGEIYSEATSNVAEATDKSVPEEPKKIEVEAWAEMYADAASSVAEVAAKIKAEQAERLRAKKMFTPAPLSAEEAAIRNFEAEEVSETTTPSAAESAMRAMEYQARVLEAQDRAEAAERNVGVSRMPRSLEALYLRPLKRVAKYGLPVCDLQLRSYSVRPLEFFADFAVRAAYYLGLPASGPVPLPRQTQRWTVPKSHFVHKKSQENFSRITLRRLIQIKDGHPETVQIWLAFLQKHAYYGIGMKANVWEFSKADVAKNMDAQVVKLEKAMADKWPLMGFKGLTEEEMAKGVTHPLMDPKKLEEFIAKERLDASGGR